MRDDNKASSKQHLSLELFILFILAPGSLVLPVHIAIKLIIVFSALTYVGFISKRMGLFNRTDLTKIRYTELFSYILLRWVLFVLVSTALMAWLLPEKLFEVVLKAPLLWIGISVFYSVFSVYPQEFIYRTFFFKRYQVLVSSVPNFLLFNAAVFSFAHLVFLNTLVFVLTFAGGLLFAYSFCKYRSLLLTSIEHSLYGLWLYTLGMGAMLAFPGP